MATAATRKSIIDLVVLATGGAPGTTKLGELIVLSDSGKTLAEISDMLVAEASFTAVYPTFATNEEFAAEYIANALPAATAEVQALSADLVVTYMNAGLTKAQILVATTDFLATVATDEVSYGSSAVLFQNKVAVATHHTITLELDTDLAAALVGVTEDVATIETVKTTLSNAVSNIVTSFALTATADAITGSAGNDLITGAAGTFGVGDVIAAGDGIDTLTVSLTGAGPVQSATTMTGVEVLNLTATPNPASVNMTGVTGLTDVNNVSSSNAATLTLSNLANVVNTAITGTDSATTIGYAATAIAATTDSATLTLNGVGAGASFVTSGVETLTVDSATSANTLSTLTNTGMTTLNITGSQALTLGATATPVGGTTITTVDASAATGALTLTIAAGASAATDLIGVTATAPTSADAGLFTLTTGALRDTVVLGAGTSSVSTGAGNDTITAGAGVGTITAGAGNDTVNAGAAVDTIRFDLAPAGTNSDTVNNFAATDVMAFNLGTATVGATPGAGVFGSLLTSAAGVVSTSPTLAGVSGTGAVTAVVFQSVAANSATANSIALATNVVALDGSFTDGTAAGAASAFGTTGQAGVTTAANSRFLVVTYAVGDIAQVWQYTGDNQTAAAGTSVLTDIDAAELQLVATLNDVAANSLTAANFSTYLNSTAATAATVRTGQTLSVSGPLNTVTSTANANGQLFTAAADTVTVALGSLPTAAAAAAAGLTLLDNTVGDADVFNAQVLNAAWDTGTVLTNIETVNLNMLVADGTGFAMTTVMPGTTAVNLTGIGGVTGITNMLSGTAIGLGAGYTGAVAITTPSALAAMTLNLNGTVGTAGNLAATSPTVTINAAAGAIAALTVNVNANTTLNADVTNVFNAAATTLAGTGNINIVGLTADFNAAVFNASGTGYTGAVTVTPTDNATAMDFSAGGISTGIRTIDLSLNAANNQIQTIAAANNSTAYGLAGALNANFVPAAASALTDLNVTILGTGTTDALAITTGARATGITGAVDLVGFETVTLGVAAASTVGGFTFGVTAPHPNTQSLTVTSSSATGAVNLGTVTGADTINTAGVAGVVSLTMGNGGVAGTTFTGGAGLTNITTSGSTLDQVTTGKGADIIQIGGSGSFTGGAGNDTYAVTTTFGVSTITEAATTVAGGTDTLLLTTAGNTATLNAGQGALSGLGIEQFVITSGGVLTVAPGQFAGGVGTINTIAAGGLATITLATAGVLNVSGLVGTAIAVATGYTGATGIATAGIAATTLTLNGTATADTITGSATLINIINGNAGADIITGGAAADTILHVNGDSGIYATTAATVSSTATLDVINVASGDVIDLTAALATDANYDTFTTAADGANLTPISATIAVGQFKGVYNSTANTFTSTATGANAVMLVVNNADAATNDESIIVVGVIAITDAEITNAVITIA